jgi:hypothetical protein
LNARAPFRAWLRAYFALRNAISPILTRRPLPWNRPG